MSKDKSRIKARRKEWSKMWKKLGQNRRDMEKKRKGVKRVG